MAIGFTTLFVFSCWLLLSSYICLIRRCQDPILAMMIHYLTLVYINFITLITLHYIYILHLHYIALYCVTLHGIESHRSALQYTTLHYTVKHCIVLHHTHIHSKSQMYVYKYIQKCTHVYIACIWIYNIIWYNKIWYNII